MVKLNSKFLLTKQINDKKLKGLYQKEVNQILQSIKDKKALGLDYIGWLNYPNELKENDLKKINQFAKKIRATNIKHLVVIGIGGSYLGIKAALDMTNAYKNNNFDVIFIHNIHPNYVLEMFNKVKNDKYAIIIISKSGGTLEPAIAFDLFRKNLISKYGVTKSNELIVAITSKGSGHLREMALKSNWQCFFIPTNIGGRYSVLTPVGLLVMAICNLNIKKLLNGAKDANKKFKNNDLSRNDAYKYACYRHYFFSNKKFYVENLIVYDPYLQMITKTMQQLFAESEGKNGKGLYPATCLFTTDLHSLGQYLQEGKKCLFETTIFVKQTLYNGQLKMIDPTIKYLNKFNLKEINNIAMFSTIKAHTYEGQVNNLIIEIDKQDEYHFGYLYTWLMYAAMMSAYLLHVNPFNQPGVEAYKKRMKNVLTNKK